MKFTLLGAGGWGANWTNLLMSDPEIDLVAVADRNPEVLKTLADRGVAQSRLFSEADEALDVTSDAVIVSVPNPARVSLMLRIVSEGRHLLVDKPLVHTTGDLNALLAAGSHRKSVFMVAQNYRLFSGIRMVKNDLVSGRIGPIDTVQVQFLKHTEHRPEYFVGNLPGILPLGIEMCIHHFDLMRYLLNAEPVRVTARGWRQSWSYGIGWTSIDAHVEFPDGVRVSYASAWNKPRHATCWPGRWDICGRDGSICYGEKGRSVEFFDPSARSIFRDPGPEVVPDSRASMSAVYRDFKASVSSVNDGASPFKTGFHTLEDNARSLSLALAVGESAETGHTVDLTEFTARHGL